MTIGPLECTLAMVRNEVAAARLEADRRHSELLAAPRQASSLRQDAGPHHDQARGLHDLWNQHTVSHISDLSRHNVDLRGQPTQAFAGQAAMRLRMQAGEAECTLLAQNETSTRNSRHMHAQMLAFAEQDQRATEHARQQAVLGH